MRKILDKRETELRLFAEDFVADFSSVAKIPDPDSRPAPVVNKRPTRTPRAPRETAGSTGRVKRGVSVPQAENFLDEDMSDLEGVK